MSRARSVAWHVNTGWWLHYLLIPVFIISVVFSALILIARAQAWPARPVACAAGGILLVAALLVFLVARRRFFRADDALVRIESNARLNSRLTCANEGVGDWPEFDENAGSGLRWKFRRILIPIAASVVCLVGSALVPVGKANEGPSSDMQEPTSWSQVDQWMNNLKQEDIVQPQDLDQLKEQLETLRRQPRQEWYSHSSLEAGDQLRDQTQKGIQELDRNLALADSVLSQLMKTAEESSMDGKKADDAKSGATGENGKNAGAKKGGEPDSATKEALSKEWQKALAGLKSGSLKLDPKTLSELSKIDPSKLKMIDPKQLKECKGRIGKGTNACAMCMGKGGKDPKFAMLVNSMTSGDGSCNMPGAGGVTRGRGDAPLTFNKDEATAKLDGQEGVSNPNLENATIGDTIAVKDTAHDVDQTAFKGPQSGGAAQDGGAGEAVWKTEVLPEEQAVLERYFSDGKK